MEYFQRELVDTMLHCGVNGIVSLGREHVQPAGGWSAAAGSIGRT